jgi:Outer membrane protein beta-barrel domain
MKKLVLLFCIAATVTAQAQHTVTPRLGASLGKVHFNPSPGKESILTRLVFGLGFDFKLKDKWHFFAEASLIGKGGKFAAVDSAGNNVTGSLGITYLEFPVMIKYVSDNFYLNAGPAFNFALSASRIIGNEDVSVGFGSKESQYNPVDINLQIGGGVLLPVGWKKKLGLDVRYGFGMISIENDQRKANNRTLTVSLVYALRSK